MKHRRKAVAAITLCGCLALAAFACSRSKTISTKDGEVKLDKDGNVVSITSDKGSVTISEGGMDIQTKEGKASASFGSKAALPRNLSKDVPVYQPAEVTMSQVLGDGEKVMLGLRTKDSAEAVSKFYAKELAGKGWKLGNTATMGNVTLLQGKKGQQKLNVTITAADEGAQISLAFTRR